MNGLPHAATLPLLILSVLLATGLGYGAYRYKGLTDAYASSTAAYEARVTSLENELAHASSTNADLGANLRSERDRNDHFANQIGDLSGTVQQLDKLSKTDPELLAKYSKVYFLNENYFPPRLVAIPKEYSYDESRTHEFHADAIDHLTDMLKDAQEDDIDLFIVSAYRSFTSQASLKNEYRVTYGSGANAFSADQGYSEHQLGTTVDLTTTGIGGALTAAFDATEAFAWLQKNAYRYGFILSYPAGNAYYIYEPWHWRFVGTELANDLRKDKKSFYDLDQREIDPYLANIFD